MNRSRRRFRFSLRTLFVVLTVLCVWLGYSLNWIRQRRDFLGARKPMERTAPLSLRIFGEKGVDFLIVNGESESRARKLFPEAVVTSIGGLEIPFRPER